MLSCTKAFGASCEGSQGRHTSEMAAAPVPILMLSSSSSSSSSSPFYRPMSRSMGPIKTLPSICPSSSPSPPSKTKRLLSRRSDTKPEEDDDNNNITNVFSSPEDVNYLWKLGAGSVGGGALIKYGSILLPEITKPNILLALIMISAPMVVATLLLIKQSRVAEQNKDPI